MRSSSTSSRHQGVGASRFVRLRTTRSAQHPARCRALSTAAEVQFSKYQGLGNDFILVDNRHSDEPVITPEQAVKLCDRNFGIGADGVIVLGESTKADVRMRMFNADGSESEMCGNGIRCLAKLAFDHGHVRGPVIEVETRAGILSVTLEKNGKRCIGATVNMGLPRLTPAEVPVVHDGEGPRLQVSLRLGAERLRLMAVGMGNPHAVIFVDDPERYAVTTIGPRIETDPSFPKRTNVEFPFGIMGQGNMRRTLLTDCAGQAAGVDPSDADTPDLLQPISQFACRAPVRRFGRIPFYHHASRGRC